MKNVQFFALLLCAVSLVGCSSLLGDNNDDPSVNPEDVGYFSIEIDDVSAHSATVSVTASDNLPADWIWDVAESDEVINEEYVEAYLLEYYAYQLEQFGATETEYPFSKFLLEVGLKAGTTDTFTFENMFSPNTVYKVWACALDEDGGAAYIKTKAFKTNVATDGGSGGNDGDDSGTITGTATIEKPFSNLTANVNFVAEEAYIIEGGSFWDDYAMPSLFNHESFYIELYGPYVGEDYEWMVLDLLAPDGATTPEGTYTVGYSGNYIALSSVRIDYGGENNYSYAGSCYGFGIDEEDLYADFESGTVKITKSGSGYNVVVDAKCGSHTIKATYTGALAPSEVVYGQSPKLYEYHTKSPRRSVGGECRMKR